LEPQGASTPFGDMPVDDASVGDASAGDASVGDAPGNGQLVAAVDGSMHFPVNKQQIWSLVHVTPPQIAGLG
jgi:hypothetical protein